MNNRFISYTNSLFKKWFWLIVFILFAAKIALQNSDVLKFCDYITGNLLKFIVFSQELWVLCTEYYKSEMKITICTHHTE